MAEAAKDQDQSMEEILQSIKRIIAEEGEPAGAGSDVLELTDMLADDGSVQKAVLDTDNNPKIAMMSIDEIMAAPISSEPAPVAEPDAAKPEPVATLPEPIVPSSSEKAPVASDESLLSDAAREASLAALRGLDEAATPAPTPASPGSFRSGETVEDLVVEALKPMLKTWLDSHLPALVERLVEKEIRKLSAR